MTSGSTSSQGSAFSSSNRRGRIAVLSRRFYVTVPGCSFVPGVGEPFRGNLESLDEPAKSLEVTTAELSAKVRLDAFESPKTSEDVLPALPRETNQSGTSIMRVGDAFDEPHRDELAHQLRDSLRCDAKLRGEDRGSGAGKGDVGVQRCVCRPWLWR